MNVILELQAKEDPKQIFDSIMAFYIEHLSYALQDLQLIYYGRNGK